MNWMILLVMLLVALCVGLIGALTSLHHAAKSQTQADPQERSPVRSQERSKRKAEFVASAVPRELEGMEAFCGDYAALPSMEHQVIVVLYWEHLSELYNLFGSETGDAAFHHFCRQCKEFAAEYDGKAYRLAFHQLALLVSAPRQTTFLDMLQNFLVEAAQLPIQKQTILYKYQVSLLRGVYFLSGAKDAGCPLSHILDCLDHEVLYNAAISKSGDIVLDDETKPDWALLSALEAEAKGSWNNHEFLPYYQPVFDIGSRKVVGCEILARWQHPTRGLLRPKQFLRILEDEGLIIDLDLYMLEEACKKISYWLEYGILTVPLTVNLSKLNLYRADFVDNLLALIEKYDIPSILIELELSEKNLLFEDNDIFVEKMNLLHQKGFSLSMDRFAQTDVSALGLLRKLPFDIIKVDVHLFETASDSSQATIYVQSFLRLAQELHIKVVVEQVETAAQVELIQSFGCTNGKGYYFSYPIPGEEFQKLIS